MATLTKASNEWANRPADERFSSLQDLHAACVAVRDSAVEKEMAWKGLHVQAQPTGALALIGPAGNPASLTNWSMKQLAARAGAPAGYLRTLPAPLAAECLNHGLDGRDDDDTAHLLFANGGPLRVRAATSDIYTRIWNADVTERLLALADRGPWQPAPAAVDGSRGLYASDHDLFAFLVDSDRRIFETLPGGGLSRGFFCWNSEVGASSFGIMTFLYEYVCGNHRVWGASGIKETRIPHIGQAGAKADRELVATLTKYADSSAAEDEARIESCRTLILGGTKDEVLDRIFGLKVPALTRTRIEAGYDEAERRTVWGDPRSAWGLAGGLSAISQEIPFADERVAVDRAAARVMALAF